MPPKQRKVCIIGSGNWGTAIARLVGFNAKRHDHLYETVTMYVYEEILDGKKLTDIINETHENIKYLPGYKLPHNVVAVADVVEAAQEADILVFVLPHQFIRKICSTLLGKIKPTACGLSLIKGFDVAEGGGIDLISHVIQRLLRINVSVLMGANIAQEVAAEKFCETTIGCKDVEMGRVFQDLIQTDNFRVVVVDDADTVEVCGALKAGNRCTAGRWSEGCCLGAGSKDKRIAPILQSLLETDNFHVFLVDDAEAVEVCGALKNIVAVGAGFVDGLHLGDNTKAAVIRLGLMEMIKFVDVFYPGSKLSTFFESCGIADLVTTCYGGRNRRVAEAFVTTNKSLEQLEEEMLNGQKLQGPITAKEVNHMLKNKNMEARFPLMTAVHNICTGQLKPAELIETIREHPEHIVKVQQEGSPQRK